MKREQKTSQHLVTDLDLCAIADEFGGSTTLTDVILEGVDELRVGLDATSISDVGDGATVEHGSLSTMVNSRSVRVDNVTGVGFISTGNIESRVGGFVGVPK